MIYEDSAFIGFAVVVLISPHNHIAVPIAVYIAGTGYRTTHIGTCLVTF